MRRRPYACCIFGLLSTFPLLLCVRAAEPDRDLLKGSVYPLRTAVKRGLEKNFDLHVVELDIPISRENVTVNEAVFDPFLDASVSSGESETSSASAFSPDGFDFLSQTGGNVGMNKKFRFGLESRLSFETNRSSNNSTIDALRPQYRALVVLDFTQPLLRDFGIGINTTDLRISENQARQAAYGYMDRAQSLTQAIEIAYYDLARSLDILRYRIESRELAKELLEGNRKKFQAGVVPITEVQEAETAVASRDEEVISAEQQVETNSNRLKNLLEIGPGDPLYQEVLITETIPGIEQPFPGLKEAVTTARETRPDLLAQRVEIENRSIRTEFYANQRLPRVDLQTTLGLNGLSGGNRPVTFAGTSATSDLVGDYPDALSRMTEGDGYEWFLGLRFSYPLGNRAAMARYRQAKQQGRQTLYTLKSLEGNADTEVRNALVNVERSMERVKVAERFVKLAQITLAQETERLKKGLSDTFRILIFQDDLISARIRKVTALVDFNTGLANLYRAMGRNLERLGILTKIDMKETGYH